MPGLLLCLVTPLAWGAMQVPTEIQNLVKRADACAAVWSAGPGASNTKFVSLEVAEKNEAVLEAHRCNLLAANVISTCLKYQGDAVLKRICSQLLVQTKDQKEKAAAPPPCVVAIPPPKPISRVPLPQKDGGIFPASGVLPSTASGASLVAPPATASDAVTPTPRPVDGSEPQPTPPADEAPQGEPPPNQLEKSTPSAKPAATP